MRKPFLVCLLALSLIGCTTTGKKTAQPPKPSMAPSGKRIPAAIEDQNKLMSLANQSYMQQGKRYFQEGYYKKSMMLFLPLACDGNPEAQYAVGYMYYYGYGVTQDKDVGYFWIQRAADQHYLPAISALKQS